MFHTTLVATAALEPCHAQQASCGTCGGSGCSGRGNGQLSCCVLNIRQTGATCSETGAAPCILDGEWSPFFFCARRMLGVTATLVFPTRFALGA